MEQLPLPGMPQHIVNVASVKHRSPFRYPGGKTWLVPRIYLWLASKQLPVAHFIEPFAGGAIVGLTAVFTKLAEYVTLVEIDEQVAAVWDTIIESEHGLWLADQIMSFEMSPANVDRLFAKSDGTLRHMALQTIIKNRVNRGGILATGAGRLKHGENGRGIQSRWYPETLAKRIRDIVDQRARLSFIHGNGLDVIEQHISDPYAIFFVDPPYTASSKKPGKRLYHHHEVDHAKLFALLAQCSGDFLMTYDNVDEAKALAKQHQFDTLAVPMKNTHHAKLNELLVGRNLDWAR